MLPNEPRLNDDLFGDCADPVSAADIAAWQQQQGVALPVRFAEHLQRFNGSAFGLHTFVATDEDEHSIECILSILQGAPNRVEDLLGADYRPSGYFPVALGLGAVEFCIRLDDNTVHELSYDGTGPSQRVANSFEAFIAAITQDDDDDWL